MERNVRVRDIKELAADFDMNIKEYDDDFNAPRKILRQIISREFPIFDEYLVSKLTERIIYQYMFGIMPEDMTEEWAEKSVSAFKSWYIDKVKNKESPYIKNEYIICESGTLLVTNEEKWAEIELSQMRQFFDEYPEEIDTPQYWGEFDGRTPREHREFAKRIIAEEQAKREAFITSQEK